MSSLSLGETSQARRLLSSQALTATGLGSRTTWGCMFTEVGLANLIFFQLIHIHTLLNKFMLHRAELFGVETEEPTIAKLKQNF